MAVDLNSDEAAIELGRRLFAQECRFVAGATGMDHLPATELVEIAFAGRSNVGKSSLINALAGHNALARTSRTPGRTQQINFFSLGGRLMLVDLPGYGYARASKNKIKGWTQLVHDYLRGRPNLRRLCLLMDSRHGIKAGDAELLELLDKAGVSYQVVLTKADQPSRRDLERVVQDVSGALARHPAAHPRFMVTSSRSGDGIAELRADLATLAASERLG